MASARGTVAVRAASTVIATVCGALRALSARRGCRQDEALGRLVVAAAAAVLPALAANAAVFLWDGDGSEGNKNWSNVLNWRPGGAPPKDGSADVEFMYSAAVYRYGAVVDAPWAVRSLLFNNNFNTYGFKLTGCLLTVGAGGVVSLRTPAVAAPVIIENDLCLAASQVWSVADEDAPLVLGGRLTSSPDVTVTVANDLGDGHSSLRLGTSPSVWNASFLGTILLDASDSLTLMFPASMTGGRIDLAGSSRLCLSAADHGGVYTFGVGSDGGRGFVTFAPGSSGGLAAVNLTSAAQTVRWDPGAGADYAWSADFRVAASSGAIDFGNCASRLILTGGSRTIGGSGLAAGPVRILSALADDGQPRDFIVDGANVILTRPVAAGSNGGGRTIIRGGTLTISAMDQIFHAPAGASQDAGNLDLAGGVLILDAVPWSGCPASFTANRAGYGPGTNQWQLGDGGGLAARGRDLVIDDTQTAQDTFDRNLTLGAAVKVGDPAAPLLFADAAVRIVRDIALSAGAARCWRILGANGEHDRGWTIGGPVHEVAGLISGGGDATVLDLLGAPQAGGTLRFANPGNTFRAGIRVGGDGSVPGGSLVVIFASGGAFGHPDNAVVVGESAAGQSAMLLLEDADPTGPTVFSGRTIQVRSDVAGRAGFGSWAGDVFFTGTLLLTGSHHRMPLLVRDGTLHLGSAGHPAAIINDRTCTVMAEFVKLGPGELVLENVLLNGAAAGGQKWILGEGTLATTVSGQVRSDGSLDFADLYPNWPAVRTWKVTGQSQTCTGVSGAFYGSSADPAFLSYLYVADGVTLTTVTASDVYAGASGAVLRKVGPGTWAYRGDDVFDEVGGTGGAVRCEEGVFDVCGAMGRTGLELAGGTILSGHVSPLTAGRLVIDQARGGKLGISPDAAGNVVTSSVPGDFVWNAAASAPLTLSSRGNHSLVIATTDFPDVGASSGSPATLWIERDAPGTGVVQISDSRVTIRQTGCIGGAGTLRLTSAATGTLTVRGTLAPGSPVGTFGIQGHLVLESTSRIQLELGWPAAAYDQISVTGNLTLGGTVSVTALPGFGPGTYDIFLYTGVLTDGGLVLGVVPQGYVYKLVAGGGRVGLEVSYGQPDAATWTGAAGDDWSLGGNWSSGHAPGPADAAVFDGPAAGQPVLYTDQQVGSVRFAAGPWTIGGAGRVLSIGPGGVTASDQAAATICPTVSLAADSTWLIDPSAAVVLASVLDGSGNSLTLRGGGTLKLPGAHDLAALDLDDATCVLTTQPAGLLVTAAITVDTTDAAFDLARKALVVDYAGATESPLTQVRNLIISGYNAAGGYWDGFGITSSAARDDPLRLTALGVIDNADPWVGGKADLEGQPLDATSVLVKYTYWGDVNLDGVVDSNDYDAIDYYLLFPPAPAEAGWWNGDLDYDGLIDSNDYDLMDYAFLFQGLPLDGGGGPGSVPEPETLALMLAGLAAAAKLRSTGPATWSKRR